VHRRKLINNIWSYKLQSQRGSLGLHIQNEREGVTHCTASKTKHKNKGWNAIIVGMRWNVAIFDVICIFLVSRTLPPRVELHGVRRNLDFFVMLDLLHLFVLSVPPPFVELLSDEHRSHHTGDDQQNIHC